MKNMKEIDARGLSCPQPVILSKKAIDKAEYPFCMLVDTLTSCNNVRRICEKANLKIEIKEADEEYKIIINI